ncbi:MAG: hypothetical protein ACTSRG_03780 [Candidatus Helarchaeota archaeon]
MVKIIKKIFLNFYSSSLLALKEELGLARGIKTAELIWKRIAEDNFPIFNGLIKTENEDETAATVNFLSRVLTEILGFEEIETIIGEDSASIRLNKCPFWDHIKENKLPPVSHKLAAIFIETLARLKSPGLVYDKIATKSMAQGGTYCEYTWKKF